jgi:hypothetical protein
MPDSICLVRLPNQELAPAYRESLSLRMHLSVEDFGGGIVGVAPAEGAGATAQHFSVHRLCAADTPLDDPVTWAPLRETPPMIVGLPEAEENREVVTQLAADMAAKNRGVLEAQMSALGLKALVATKPGELEALLQASLPELFARFPQGVLLYVTVDSVLLTRLTFGRSQLALQLTPDVPLASEELKAFSELTMSRGINVAAWVSLSLVALSPVALGFTISAAPHALVFCFGEGVDLRRTVPLSLSYTFRPQVLSDPMGLDRSAFLSGLASADGEQLVRWWADRLNCLYSYVADPTRWTDPDGYHDAAAQTAWLVTLERLIADAVSLLAEPQAADLHRVQMAFDVLDKAEALLGYGRKKTGKGFEALLRREECLRRLHQAYTSLPDGIADRLSAEAERLFDGLYAQVRQNTLRDRLTPNGARIAQRSASELLPLDDSSLVAGLCRAVRNSSHGILDTLRDHDDRFLLAANTDGIPAELPALVPLIALGLLADPEGLADGSWRKKLVERAQRNH